LMRTGKASLILDNCIFYSLLIGFDMVDISCVVFYFKNKYFGVYKLIFRPHYYRSI